MGHETMDAMERKLRLSMLLAFYGEMLTDNQREMARLHWEEDLSLAEIAQQFSVSRQSVHDTLNRTEKQLETLEEKLGLHQRFQRQEACLTEAAQALRQVIPSDETASYLHTAERWIASALEQEEG